MSLLIAIFLGIVQGLTEFLPVSSSGHLVILHDFFTLDLGDEVVFDVALHMGTLVALLGFFYKDIIRYALAFLKSLVHWNLKNDQDQRLAWYMVISVIPAALVGYFAEDVLTATFRNLWSVAIILIVVSFLFFLAEKYSQQNLDWKNLTWQKALGVGLAQAVALIPGVSRSGITIVTGLFFNLKRETAARFSFLISIPVVFAAGIKKIFDLLGTGASGDNFLLYLLGFLSAVIIGYFCLKYFLKFLQKNSLAVFAYYRIALGLLVICYLLIK